MLPEILLICRENFISAPRPRPPGVPKLDLKPVTEAQVTLPAVPSAQFVETARLMEMEYGTCFDEHLHEGNSRYSAHDWFLSVTIPFLVPAFILFQFGYQKPVLAFEGSLKFLKT